MKTLRLILGDQLNQQHSWFKDTNDDVVYCLFEMRQETDYVVHHIQKIIGFFASMRAFAKQLEEAGHKVVYFKLDDKNNTQDLEQNLNLLIKEHKIQKFEYQLPDEYRLDAQLKSICKNFEIESEAFDTEHFYTKRDDLKDFFKGKKTYLMESFYRNMRKKEDILMLGKEPEGGKWNYDHSNRKKWTGKGDIPHYKWFINDVEDIVQLIESSDIKTMGRFNQKTFSYPINREQALEQLQYFCDYLLVHFGDFQDAMHTDEVYLFHSRISFAMNIKLVSPREVVDKVLNYYYDNTSDIHISQVEGFVRQIIGWREYMRGMYWALMPDYKTKNELNNTNPLPDFYWTGNTKMNCMHQAINNSLDNAYAHHIQRLMITGNYALLTQCHPDEVDAWYLGIYIDALEWVQLTNTRGMSQYADGGLIATKPYVSSGKYIDKMSNYCQSCHYNKNKKVGDDACPFNSLYWNFLDDKRNELSNNRRMGLMYGVMDKMKSADIEAMKERAKNIISHPENY
ncbi:cryptochrome/photolyase family protein [Winogradskyella maritima]|uniref:Cryptochrome/photolyase family protein n=1 Tax=Winogradskyella maritima TaxID=1517766 RepID=A0ABV8AC94_9FLAO|nr:cryptochrome/photolyase family protein [Winogradskyella maritima]